MQTDAYFQKHPRFSRYAVDRPHIEWAVREILLAIGEDPEREGVRGTPRRVANALYDALGCRGSIVVVEAEHFCMTMRGVKKPGRMTVTRAARGVCAEDGPARQEALSLITGNR